MNGEIEEAKYYEQELLKSEFDFESNNKVLESLNINLSANKYKDGQEIDSIRLNEHRQILVYHQIKPVNYS